MAKILIVDDEPRIRELIRENLQYSGYTCEEAGDGSAALSLLTGGGYDLVILDLMMPFMDGMTCLREMRTRRINTPVIILTARGEEYDKLAGLESAWLILSHSWLMSSRSSGCWARDSSSSRLAGIGHPSCVF